MVERVEGQGRRVLGRVLSIVLRSGYTIGVLIYVAFYTGQFTLFQKVVVLFVALIIFAAAESIVRVSRHRQRRVVGCKPESPVLPPPIRTAQKTSSS